MARSQASFTKKEREKQRSQKKKEKEYRSEERKANSKEGRPLEEMMAYVDENGNITSTPPDPTKKHSIRTDEILIGARKVEHDKPNALHLGRVSFYNSSKGYGFIKDDQTGESVFMHNSVLQVPVKENDKVSFQIENSPRGLAATNVKKI